MNDRWENVSALEKQYVNAVLDNYGSAYDEIEKFEAQFREFVGTRYALAHCNGTSTIHAAVFASGARRRPLHNSSFRRKPESRGLY